MQRIALVSEHASPLAATGDVDSGGQNVYVAAVARELARRGIAVDVFTRRDHPSLPSVVPLCPGARVVHVDAGPARHLPKEHLLPFMGAFAEVLERAFATAAPAYDCVHANFFMSAWAALKATRRLPSLNLPLVTTFHALGRVRRMHQGTSDAFPDERLDIEEELVRVSHRVIAECPQDRDDLLQLYGARAERIDIVPCGYDAVDFRPGSRAAMRASLGWDPDEFTVLQLGRLVPRKGIDTVIEALGILRHDHAIEARLYIVGGSSERPSAVATPEIGRLTACAKAAGVVDRVVFVGRRDRPDLHRFFSAADVFVTTPWYEPFGITPIEAMACGTPVIGSAVGGIRTTVVDGVTGWLVPPRDAHALADRLARLAGDETTRHAFGEAGRRRAEALYTWSRVTDQLIGVYRQAIADGRDATHVRSTADAMASSARGARRAATLGRRHADGLPA